MARYEVNWSAFGIATVEAESEQEAQKIVSDRAFQFDDIDFEGNEVDGVDIHDVEEAK